MSIRLIYGRAGTGKSEYCFKETRKIIQNNALQKVYIIVPEQFSYLTEKRLLENLQTESSIFAEVISFNRLAFRIANEVGGIKETNLTKTGRAMLIANILEKEKKNLNFLGKTNEIDLILRTITELKKHNISNNFMKEKIKEINNTYLKLKLNDINNIYTKYENAIKNNYIDEDDILTILSKNIEKSKILNDSIIFIDEFSGFTEQEYEIIKEILKKAKQVNITICTDKLSESTGQETDIFYSNKQMVQKLINLCSKNKIKIEPSVELNKTYRFKNEELKFLEENIYSPRYKVYDKEINHIYLELCLNPYNEIEQVAQKIINLARNNNLRYKEISVITKNIEEYSSIISAVFAKYDIPVFIDGKKELSDNILIQYILAIFEIFDNNWSLESVISYIKTGILDIENEDIYKLENYCKKWGIRGNKWYKEDWNYDSTNKDLETLNNLRKKIVNPLIELNSKLKNGKNAQNITIELYNFIEKNNIREKLENKIEKLKLQKEFKYAEEYEGCFNTLINILDEINMVFKGEKITYKEYKNILKTGLEVSKMGEIPEVIDQVIIGDIERSRSHKTSALFIIGVNDGDFPNNNFTEGFLNDEDRNNLKNIGIELAKGSLENLYEDQFNIYKAFTTAENKIFLSYISSDKEGKAKRPSTLITKIKKIFPKIIETSNIVEEKTVITTPKATFSNLLENIRNLKKEQEIDNIWKATYIWYNKNSEWSKKLKKSIRGFETRKNNEKISEENIKRLYGNILKTSVSRLEQYRKCPFSFYLKYGLKLKEKEELNIKPIDTGSFMHEVIDTFFEQVQNIKEIKEEEIEKITNQIIEDKLSLSKNYIFTSTPKFIILTNRLKRVIFQSIKYIVYQIKNSDFEILGNEVEFKRKIDNVEITGKVDRIDMAKTSEGKYIRIIDYKSSDKNIDLNELVSGTQIQLITYMDSMLKEDDTPAGMFYFKLIDPIIKSDRNKTDEQIKEELKKKFRMNGMIIADINIIKMMDKSLEKGASDTIPVYLDKEGSISNTRSNAITKEQFTSLQKTVNKVIKQIAKEILEGNIEIKPSYSKKTKVDACKYCEYKSICGFDPNINNYSYIENKIKEEVLERITKKEI